jgi:NAD(P)-dependent dehydrogenase (short-subunit alcohol dehydrogenase family)
VLVAGDVSTSDHCREIVKKAVDEFGRIDVLVNNAAHQMSLNAIEEISDEEWEKTLSTNISAMFYIVKAAVAQMSEGSSIINTASVNADAPSPISWPTPPPKGQFRTSQAASLSFWRRRASGPTPSRRAGLDTADSFNNADRDCNALRRTGSDEATRATVRGCVCYVRKRAIFQARPLP